MRERVPTCWGIFLLILRLVSAALNITTIALLVHCTKAFGVTLEMGYAAAGTALFVDLIEIVPLADPTRQLKRFQPPLLTFLESAVFLLCIIGVMFVAMKDASIALGLGEESDDEQSSMADPFRMAAIGLQAVVAVIHFYFMTSICCIWCKASRRQD